MARPGSSGYPFEFAARMTEYQFRSMARRISHSDTASELKELDRVSNPKVGANSDPLNIEKWLVNGWNTELILQYSSTILDGASGAALQWTFPQAYYACFSFALAFFDLAGFTEKSHTGVRRKFAEIVSDEMLPTSISFLSNGTVRNMFFEGLNPSPGDISSIDFKIYDPKSWDKQIEQFLRSTREIELKNKKSDLKLKTKSGKIRKSFREQHWELASQKIGPTALLCLLYRKRIKSNYRDIDTFTSSGINPEPILSSLQEIVNEVAFVFETFIASALGFESYNRFAQKYLENQNSKKLLCRVQVIKEII